MGVARNLALQNKKQPLEKCVVLIAFGCKGAEPVDLLSLLQRFAMRMLKPGELTTIERHWAGLRPRFNGWAPVKSPVVLLRRHYR